MDYRFRIVQGNTVLRFVGTRLAQSREWVFQDFPAEYDEAVVSQPSHDEQKTPGPLCFQRNLLTELNDFPELMFNCSDPLAAGQITRDDKNEY